MADGDIPVPFEAEAFGFRLKAAFGNPATTGTGNRTHSFKSGSWPLPGMATEVAMPRSRALPRMRAARSIISAAPCGALAR